MPARHRNVIFDVGNVLLGWEPRKLLQEQLPADADHEHFLQSIFSHQTWTDLDEGTIEEEQANELFAARVGRPVAEIRQLILASKASLYPMVESVQLLKDLHHSGTRLYCLTNMARGTFQFVYGRFPFWKLFEGIVVSSFIRKIKPDPAIFRYLLDTYRLPAKECFFLDDNAANVEGARSVGIEAEVFESAGQMRELLLGGP